MIDFPNLSNAKLIGYDTETYDPYLKEDGPGWARGVGHVLGVSLAVDVKNKWYIPLGKTPDPKVIRYLKDVLETPIPKTGANLMYDYGWLSELGINPGGMQYDIQFAEALLDDVLLDPYNRKLSISLDALSQRYLNVRKTSSKLEAYTKERWPHQQDFRENLWRCPTELVGEYAVDDAELPIRILKLQWQMLQEEGLIDVFNLECKLIPLLVKMRQRGLPVDVDKANDVRDQLMLAESIMKKRLKQETGISVNVNSGKDLAVVFDKFKLPYPRTAKGNPSFAGDVLSSCEHPVAGHILELRKLIKTRSTFIENAILEKQINGKVYPSFHPLRTDDAGTISGRFSCTKPNAQQISKRDKVWAPLVRSLFCPEEGFPEWASLDYSQIEYRVFAHFSNDAQLIKAYSKPDADFHSVVGQILGGKLPRGVVKNFNFMMLYGGGKAKLAAMLKASLSKEEAEKLYNEL